MLQGDSGTLTCLFIKDSDHRFSIEEKSIYITRREKERESKKLSFIKTKMLKCSKEINRRKKEKEKNK